MVQDGILDDEDEDEEKRVEEERRKLKELGLEGASINAFKNITSSDQKNSYEKRQKEQKSKKFIGFGEQ